MALEFTPEEQLQLELLLSKREKATGMPQAKPPKVGSGGAMTDASKRQRDDHGDEPTFSPESPSESYSSEMVEIVFPNGITSLEQWGKVVITMEAYKGKKMTFAKAVALANDDAKMRQYLNFILGKYGKNPCMDPPNQAIDLAMYLQAVNYEPKKGGYVRVFEQ